MGLCAIGDGFYRLVEYAGFGFYGLGSQGVKRFKGVKVLGFSEVRLCAAAKACPVPAPPLWKAG